MVRPYFEDMVSVLKASDIAVARSGSLSLSEICACGVASILIPYPHAAADHQRINAKYMQGHKAALYLEEQLEEIKQNVSRLARLNGVDKIVQQLNEGLV